MTQPSRTTETINRDHEAIRNIMHQIRELTVPDRATLALGLVGHLATMMNRHQMTKLMAQLQEEAERVQDVPPSRERDDQRKSEDADETIGRTAGMKGAASSREADPEAERQAGRQPARKAGREAGHSVRSDAVDDRGRSADDRDTIAAGDRRTTTNGTDHDAPALKPHGDVLGGYAGGSRASGREGVGQAGRGEFRSRKLL